MPVVTQLRTFQIATLTHQLWCCHFKCQLHVVGGIFERSGQTGRLCARVSKNSKVVLTKFAASELNSLCIHLDPILSITEARPAHAAGAIVHEACACATANNR